MKHRFLNIITLFKNQAFEDEKEVRLIYCEHKELYEDLGIQCAPKRFRYGKGLIIPFCDTKFLQERKKSYSTTDIKEVERLPIEEVIVGPQENQEVLIRGIKEYLIANNYSDVAVKSSSIPFR